MIVFIKQTRQSTYYLLRPHVFLPTLVDTYPKNDLNFISKLRNGISQKDSKKI